MSACRRSSYGFTLMELLIVIAVVGILASVALPSFRSLILSQQVKTASFEFYASLNQARSEAIKRNGNVTVTPVSGSWQLGWTITASSGEVIKAHGSLPGVIITGGPSSLVYTRSGRISGSPAFQIDSSTTQTANVRCLRVELSGMPRTIKGACV